MTGNNAAKQKRSWYLRKHWVYIMILLLFPVGLINVLVHRNYWQRDERREYTGILGILGYFWVLSNFLPSFGWIGISIPLIVFMVIGSLQLVRN